MLVTSGAFGGNDSSTEQARLHFQQGQQFFDVGRWDDAADEFEKAYALRSDPTFLFNMAQAYRRKGDAKRALDLYKNFLIKAPKSPQRADVEERIRALQKQLDDADAAKAGATASPTVVAPVPLVPAPPPVAQPGPAPAAAPAPGVGPALAPSATVTSPAPAPGPQQAAPASSTIASPANESAPSYVQVPAQSATPSSPGRGLRVTGIVCGAVGVASVGAGILFGAQARSFAHKVESSSRFNPDDQDRGKMYENLQWVGYGVGGALIVAGAVFYGLGAASAGPAPSVALVPTVLPDSVGLHARGTF